MLIKNLKKCFCSEVYFLHWMLLVRNLLKKVLLNHFTFHVSCYTANKYGEKKCILNRQSIFNVGTYFEVTIIFQNASL